MSSLAGRPNDLSYVNCSECGCTFSMRNVPEKILCSFCEEHYVIMTIIREASAELNMDAPTLLARDGFRWILDDYPGLGPNMIKLERLLHKKTGRPIDLRVATKEDRNKRDTRTGRMEKIKKSLRDNGAEIE